MLGFITVAMSHMEKNRIPYFEKKSSDANIPALLIGHLATHKDALRRGIGRELVRWAIREALEKSKRIGYRIVMFNPEDDQGAHDFYKAVDFTYVKKDDKTKDAYVLDIQLEKI